MPLDEDGEAMLALLAELEARNLACLPMPTIPASSVSVETLAAISETPQPSAPTQAPEPLPVERTTLAENFVVQWLVHQVVPWNYQQNVLDGLHKIRLRTWQLALVLIVALGAGVATGYVALPAQMVDGLRATYRGFACPIPAAIPKPEAPLTTAPKVETPATTPIPAPK